MIALSDAAMRIERIVDANANRAAEGLRVLEEVARFLLDHAVFSEQLKTMRHALRQAAATCAPGAGLQWRDTAGDVGTALTASDELVRGDVEGLIQANAKRVAEALRVLAECCKIPAQGDSSAQAVVLFEQTRYQLYDLERDLLASLPVARWRDIRLYVLVDASLCEDPVAIARSAVAGGAQAIQLRAKACNQREYAELAARVRDAIAGQAAFVVNDHVAVAAWLQADAVHCGQDDLPVAAVRAVVGPLMAVGLSTHSTEQVATAQADGATYLGIGPMYATTTKPHEPERGTALLAAAAPLLRVPSFAIGGLNLDRVTRLRPSLPHGVAVAGAVCQAADPQAACAAFRAVLDDEPT